jgi:hypothetical protein
MIKIRAMIKIFKFIIILLLFTIIPYLIGNYFVNDVWSIQYLFGLLILMFIITLLLFFIVLIMELDII